MADFDEGGFQIVEGVLTKDEIEHFRSALDLLRVAPGHRHLMRIAPVVAELACSTKILQLLTGFLGTEPFPVRSIFFDKTIGSNWLVPWHQDLSIAVETKFGRAGYGPWSVKGGVPHVQPPLPILESMITLRLHLDACDASNGALRVIPGSHKSGKLDASKIAEWRALKKEVLCKARAGDALIMRPLLLHASSEASTPSHRRVIHIEYATCPLADGLQWAEKRDIATPHH